LLNDLQANAQGFASYCAAICKLLRSDLQLQIIAQQFASYRAAIRKRLRSEWAVDCTSIAQRSASACAAIAE
jgi:hypothetical protein